jgi:D-psicose/D-tagatose/L-ribulose 3-epimerase
VKLGLSIYLWTTDVTEDYFYLFRDLKTAGYDGVELPVGSGNTPNYAEIRKLLDGEGLACTTITNVGPDKHTVSPDPAVRRAALDEIKFGIEASQTLGSDILVGPYQAAYAHFTGAGPTEDEVDRAAEVLREASEFAASAGLRLGVEFLNRFEGYLLNTMEQSAALARKVDHPAFGVLYDTHHANIEEADVGAVIRSEGEHIYHVHFSENNRGPLGSGQVHWQETVDALRDIGYDDWIVAEAFAADVPNLSSPAHVWRNTVESKEQFARDAIAFMRESWR